MDISLYRPLRSIGVSCALVSASLSLLTPAQPSYAQKKSKKPSKKDIAAAKALFKKAEEQAANQEYEAAATSYLGAYAFFPSPDFLFNAAEMYRYSKNTDKARIYYEEYLRLAPDGKGADAARQGLEALPKKQVEPTPQTPEPIAPEPEPEPAVKPLPPPPVQKTKSTESGSSGSLTQYAGLATIGLGVVGLGVGTFYTFRSRSISQEVSDSPVFDPELEKRGENAERNAFIFLGAGAALGIGGALMYWMGAPEPKNQDSLAISPHVSQRQIGIVAAGSF